MTDRIALQEGDELRCPRCNAWHPIYVKYPDEPAIAAKHALYFNCPKASASFAAGRIEEEPRDPSRWRRVSTT
jgi:hypothetical protein